MFSFQMQHRGSVSSRHDFTKSCALISGCPNQGRGCCSTRGSGLASSSTTDPTLSMEHTVLTVDITITRCTLLSIHLLYPGGQKYTICSGTQNCLVMSRFGDTSIPLWMAAVPASLVSLFPSRGL